MLVLGECLMQEVQVRHYLDRARDFLKGMELLKEDLTEFGHSTALLGIHGAISYCDALRVGLGSRRLSSDNHASATKELKLLLGARKFEEQKGIGRLKKMLAQKSMVAYSPNRVSEREVVAIIQQARRFALWAEAVGRHLKIEGWKDA
jgi:hypothetical protein